MIIEYSTLNDASSVYSIPSLAEGETSIWYCKPAFIRTFIMGYEYAKSIADVHLTAASIQETHELLGKISSVNLEEIFNDMQGDVWSPNGEARSLIIAKDLNHTSMSVGDIIEIAGKFYFVDFIGFTELNK